jgi:hypothetical protein
MTTPDRFVDRRDYAPVLDQGDRAGGSGGIDDERANDLYVTPTKARVSR